MDKLEEVKRILEKWFNEPIDKPCSYCEAAKEICQQFPKTEDNLNGSLPSKAIRILIFCEYLPLKLFPRLYCWILHKLGVI